VTLLVPYTSNKTWCESTGGSGRSTSACLQHPPLCMYVLHIATVHVSSEYFTAAGICTCGH